MYILDHSSLCPLLACLLHRQPALHTFVPQPNKNPVARVEATDAQEFGPGGYNGINEGTKR